MARTLYIIKGTGLALDGQIVNIVDEGEGDYVVVSPPNTYSGVRNTMVKRACLQEINEGGQTFMYQFTIRRLNEDPKGDGMDADIRTLNINKCIRNVDLGTILDYLESNLRPILRME